ncbi:MAG: DUF362 domain-containing protein [Candidatus Latescibacteria bacterium]|jgi:uncharacterized protein (DUF362 family)|nr:DUF362 domain-containing protein [Candidatus Latescibacterota bacterium]
MSEKRYAVRAARCDHQASEEEIYATLRRITDPLARSWQKLEQAERVVLKFNMMMPPDRVIRYEGRRRELVDDAVCRAVLRLLRERTSADLVATDATAYGSDHLMGDDFNYAYLLREFDVDFVDSNVEPFRSYEVPGGGLMFDRYTLSACFEGAEVVSVCKMKNHAFMGLTLCMKNLFGLPPITPPAGRVRSYFHHFIRLSHVLPDLGLITNPCLNIIDALTGQWGREWGGEGRICDALIAGDQVTATDACGAHLMGHDPASDWPTPPFRRDRNHLLVAAQRGFGTVDLDEIDFQTEVEAPLADFDSVETDSAEMVRSWRRTTCEQALIFRDRQDAYTDRYAGEFIFLQDGDVVWNGPDPSSLGSRRDLSGRKKAQGMWLKLVDPQEKEGEQFEVYESLLPALAG